VKFLALHAVGLVVGLLPCAQPQFKFLLVAKDYFTKWVEAVLSPTSQGSQLLNSFDRTSYVAKDFLIPSSLTMGPTSRAGK